MITTKDFFHAKPSIVVFLHSHPDSYGYNEKYVGRLFRRKNFEVTSSTKGSIVGKINTNPVADFFAFQVPFDQLTNNDAIQKHIIDPIIEFLEKNDDERQSIFILEIPMRRIAQEIKNQELIEQVIAHALVCRLGLCKDNVPYIVPVSFGYDGTSIFFHTAPEGLKLDFFAANPQVCFEFEDEVKTISKPEACQWSASYASVIGYGTITEITGAERKTYALNQIMKHYSGREWNFDQLQFAKTRVWAIAIDRMIGKQSKDKIANR